MLGLAHLVLNIHCLVVEEVIVTSTWEKISNAFCKITSLLEVLVYYFGHTIATTILMNSLKSKYSAISLPSVLDEGLDCQAISSIQVPNLCSRVHERRILYNTFSHLFKAQVLGPDCKRSNLHERAIANACFPRAASGRFMAC